MYSRNGRQPNAYTAYILSAMPFPFRPTWPAKLCARPKRRPLFAFPTWTPKYDQIMQSLCILVSHSRWLEAETTDLLLLSDTRLIVLLSGIFEVTLLNIPGLDPASGAPSLPLTG